MLVIFVLAGASVQNPQMKETFITSGLSSSASWTVSSPVVINNWVTANATYPWINGAGTAGNPYRIENVTFDAGYAGGCLEINAPFAYFEIINCTFANSSSGAMDGGLELYGTGVGVVSGCTFTNNSNGIYGSGGPTMYIIDCDVYNNSRKGMYIAGMNDMIVHDNRVYNNSEEGIRFNGGNNVTVSFNVLTTNAYTQLVFETTDNASVIANNISAAQGAITMGQNIHNATISWNEMHYLGSGSNTGIQTYELYNSTVEYNTIEGFYQGLSLGSARDVNVSNIQVLDSINDGIVVSWSNNVNLSYCNSSNQGYFGLYLDNSDNCRVEHSLFNDNSFRGINFANSENNVIYNCQVNGHPQQGIQIATNSHGNQILGCQVENNIWGINVDNFIDNTFINGCAIVDNEYGVSADSPTAIQENYISGNQYGVSLWIENCTVYRNVLAGNWRASSDAGGIGVYGNNARVINNTIMESKSFGVRLDNVINVTVEGNLLYENDIGVDLSSSPVNDSMVIRNTFLYHATANVHVNTLGINNAFNNTVMGNAWWDYTGTDSNGDGIGETPYVIDGSNHDYMPIVAADFTGFTGVTPNQTVEFTVGSVAINWTILDTALINPVNPRGTMYYSIYVNGSLVLNRIPTFLGDEVSCMVPVGTRGLHEIMIEVMTGFGCNTSNTVGITSINTPPAVTAHASFGTSFFNGTTGNTVNFNVTDPSFASGAYNLTINGSVVSSGIHANTSSLVTFNVDWIGPGTHRVGIEIDDGYGATGSASMNVTVVKFNEYPVINVTTTFSGGFVNGSTGNVVTFTITDEFLINGNFTLWIDGKVVQTGNFTSSPLTLTLNVDGLEPGEHNVVLDVSDDYGGFDSESAIFNITAPQTTGVIGVNDVPFIILVASGTISIIAIVLQRQRRAMIVH